MTYTYFSYHHIYHGLTQEKFGSEEVKIAPLTPLPTILSKTVLVLFCPPKNCFVTPYTIFMVLGTPTGCSIFYHFWGSPSLITTNFPISNYASASSFCKSTGSSRFPKTPSYLTDVCHSNSRQWIRRHDPPASIHLTSCAIRTPHQAGVNPIFSENTEAAESVRDEKGSSTPEKRNISYSSNIQPRRVSSFAALYTLSRATLQSLEIGLL